MQAVEEEAACLSLTFFTGLHERLKIFTSLGQCMMWRKVSLAGAWKLGSGPGTVPNLLCVTSQVSCPPRPPCAPM